MLQWIPDIINVSGGTISDVSYGRFLHAGFQEESNWQSGPRYALTMGGVLIPCSDYI